MDLCLDVELGWMMAGQIFSGSGMFISKEHSRMETSELWTVAGCF